MFPVMNEVLFLLRQHKLELLSKGKRDCRIGNQLARTTELGENEILRRSFSIFSASQNPFGLKLPQLLSQYLYQTRKIDLPGIGSFTLDPAVVIPQETDRIGQIPATGISFKNANISVPDDALVNFIKEVPGKMKSLAAADLDFYLTTGKQLLNIGKPFYLEGIGTLIKNKEGYLDFTPGDYMVARLDEHHPNAERKATSFNKPPRDHDGGQSANLARHCC